MSNVLTPLPQIELVVQALLESLFPTATVGGDLLGTPPDEYIRISKVPGASRADRFEGTFVLDVEFFDRSYLDAESRALDADAALLGYPHVVAIDAQTVVIDSVENNAGPAATFWDDPDVSRILSTYVFTIRR